MIYKKEQWRSSRGAMGISAKQCRSACGAEAVMQGAVPKHLMNSRRVVQEWCRSSAGAVQSSSRMVQEKCRRSAGAVQEQCRSSAGAVLERCRRGAGAVQERCRSGGTLAEHQYVGAVPKS